MMKKLLFLLFVIGMMTVNAQESKISFVDENGYEVQYPAKFLAEVIATSDTLVDDDELFLEEYESVFPSKRGANEPAILVLLPDDYEFYVIVIQENKKGKVLALRILTRNGWIQADEASLLIAKNLF